MGFAKYFALIAFSLLFLGMTFAVPGIPHQFYGYVTINGAPADGAGIVAKINNVERASTTTVNGNYGFNPSIFYVPDPNSTNNGKTVEFFLSGTSVASYTFENGASTRLDLFIGDAPFCGDGICNVDETTETCSEDCGTGSVCGDGTCDTDENCDSCSDDCGACPTCGDGTCDPGEDCSNCSADCGACDTGGAPTGGGPTGGGPTGGGGGIELTVKIEGKCVGQPTVVTTLNTVGNPAKNASVIVTFGGETVEEGKTDDDGIISFTFEEEGEYKFYVTKTYYRQSTKTIELAECVGGEEVVTGSGEGEEETGGMNFCAGVDCDDDNPCTVEFCLPTTGHCTYENQENGEKCSAKGTCQKGVCAEPVEERGEPGPVFMGFFGLGTGQQAGAGIVVVALIALLAYLFAAGKRKKKK